MNKSFKIIPVLDLKEGIVVLGMKGERDKYKPLESILTSSVQVMEVIKAFYQKVYLTEYYLADLDAIGSSGERNQLSLIAEREKNGLNYFRKGKRQEPDNKYGTKIRKNVYNMHYLCK